MSMKKMIKKYRKAKGFTLVELLIVIIIIGILAGMMMLSTGAATDKAEATKILSDMRNVKAAAMMFFADYDRYPEGTNDYNSMDKYLDGTRDPNITIAVSGTNSDDVKVQYDSNAASTSTGIKDKLDAMVTKGTLSKDSELYTMPIRVAN